jgi:hypothetical protein
MIKTSLDLWDFLNCVYYEGFIKPFFSSSPYLRSPETVTSTDSPIANQIFNPVFLTVVFYYLTTVSGIIPHINTCTKSKVKMSHLCIFVKSANNILTYEAVLRNKSLLMSQEIAQTPKFIVIFIITHQ